MFLGSKQKHQQSNPTTGLNVLIRFTKPKNNPPIFARLWTNVYAILRDTIHEVNVISIEYPGYGLLQGIEPNEEAVGRVQWSDGVFEKGGNVFKRFLVHLKESYFCIVLCCCFLFGFCSSVFFWFLFLMFLPFSKPFSWWLVWFYFSFLFLFLTQPRLGKESKSQVLNRTECLSNQRPCWRVT